MDEINVGTVSAQLLKEEAKLTPDEWKEDRSCAGSLQVQGPVL